MVERPNRGRLDRLDGLVSSRGLVRCAIEPPSGIVAATGERTRSWCLAPRLPAGLAPRPGGECHRAGAAAGARGTVCSGRAGWETSAPEVVRGPSLAPG